MIQLMTTATWGALALALTTRALQRPDAIAFQAANPGIEVSNPGVTLPPTRRTVPARCSPAGR